VKKWNHTLSPILGEGTLVNRNTYRNRGLSRISSVAEIQVLAYLEPEPGCP